MLRQAICLQACTGLRAWNWAAEASHRSAAREPCQWHSICLPRYRTTLAIEHLRAGLLKMSLARKRKQLLPSGFFFPVKLLCMRREGREEAWPMCRSKLWRDSRGEKIQLQLWIKDIGTIRIPELRNHWEFLRMPATIQGWDLVPDITITEGHSGEMARLATLFY